MGNSEFSVETNYNDVVQFSFSDSYFNLTLSTLLIYNWTRATYSYYDYIIKVDSDVYPNIQLINLYALTNSNVNRTVFGYYYHKMRTNRNITNPNYLPFEIYSYSTIPQFVAGSFYIFKIFSDWIDFLKVMNIDDRKLIYREDIQLGIYFKAQKIKIVKINYYYKRKDNFTECKDYLLHLAVHGVNLNLIYFIYNFCQRK